MLKTQHHSSALFIGLLSFPKDFTVLNSREKLQAYLFDLCDHFLRLLCFVYLFALRVCCIQIFNTAYCSCRNALIFPNYDKVICFWGLVFLKVLLSLSCWLYARRIKLSFIFLLHGLNVQNAPFTLESVVWHSSFWVSYFVFLLF